ncbi:MAG: HAD domain-containing protein [Burkholderiaceae bacterium]
MILYLDFDGVLHDEDVVWMRAKGIVMRTPGRSLFEWEPILVDLLAPHPRVQIVLSTSWVRVKSFNYAKHRLSQPLRDRVVGATYNNGQMIADSFAAMPRGMQIWGDVVRRQPEEWMAIDDDDFGWPAWCRDKLVLTHEKRGLNDTSVQKELVEKLRFTRNDDVK